MKIAVYAIMKNEADVVQRWLSCLEGADGIFVADTGSTDDTVAILERAGVKVSHFKDEFRFDHARNFALAQIPPGFDVAVSIDADEVFSKGWANVIRTQFTGNFADYTIIFDHDAQGNVTNSYPRCAIHKIGSNARWEYPAHEILSCDGPTQLLPIACVHKSKGAKPAGHYLDLLRKGVESYDDARSWMYYARELFYKGDYKSSLEGYLQHIRREARSEFITDSYINMAYCCARSNDDLGRDMYLAQAVYHNKGFMREVYATIVTLCGESYRALDALERMREIPKPNTFMVLYHEYYTEQWVLRWEMVHQNNVGNVKAANEAAKRLVEMHNHKISVDLLRDITEHSTYFGKLSLC